MLKNGRNGAGKQVPQLSLFGQLLRVAAAAAAAAVFGGENTLLLLLLLLFIAFLLLQLLLEQPLLVLFLRHEPGAEFAPIVAHHVFQAALNVGAVRGFAPQSGQIDAVPARGGPDGGGAGGRGGSSGGGWKSWCCGDGGGRLVGNKGIARVRSQQHQEHQY